MEKIKTVQDDQLLDYLDGKLEGPALLQLKRGLADSTPLQNRLEELRLVHKALSSARLQSPSPSFVTKVMRNLHSTAFPPSLSPRNGLLLVIGVLVTAGLLVALVSAGSFDQWTGFVSLEEVTPLKEYFRVSLPTVYINGKLLIKILVGLNLGLAFIVLDRTVLKPFFQRRAGSQY